MVYRFDFFADSKPPIRRNQAFFPKLKFLVKNLVRIEWDGTNFKYKYLLLSIFRLKSSRWLQFIKQKWIYIAK